MFGQRYVGRLIRCLRKVLEVEMLRVEVVEGCNSWNSLFRKKLTINHICSLNAKNAQARSGVRYASHLSPLTSHLSNRPSSHSFSVSISSCSILLRSAATACAWCRLSPINCRV